MKDEPTVRCSCTVLPVLVLPVSCFSLPHTLFSPNNVTICTGCSGSLGVVRDYAVWMLCFLPGLLGISLSVGGLRRAQRKREILPLEHERRPSGPHPCSLFLHMFLVVSVMLCLGMHTSALLYCQVCTRVVRVLESIFSHWSRLFPFTFSDHSSFGSSCVVVVICLKQKVFLFGHLRLIDFMI